MKFVLATKNKGKVSELRKILQDSEIVTMTEAGFDEDIVEDGSTFEENALIKARTVCKALGTAAIADDSGIEVYALDMAPGIYSARYAGEDATDEDRVIKLLSELEGKDDRRARFVCAAALCLPDGREAVCKGIIEGVVLQSPRGDGGFGYDPVFKPIGFDKTVAEMSGDEKNEISHRAKAFMALKETIEKLKKQG